MVAILILILVREYCFEKSQKVAQPKVGQVVDTLVSLLFLVSNNALPSNALPNNSQN